MPQAFPKEAKELIEADIVFSNKNDGDILSLINEYNLNKNRLIKIEEHKAGDNFWDCSIDRFHERIRAFVKIEDGCDRFCSYCIIPKSRGRVRSKSLDMLKNEIETLSNAGIKEIVLVGINLSAYGKGENFNIVDAVKICNENDKIKRIRLGSLEPDHLTMRLSTVLQNVKSFVRNFTYHFKAVAIKRLKV